MGAAGGAISAGALAAGGFRLSEGAEHSSAPPAELLIVDESDPLATPHIYHTPGGIDFRLPPPTATATPTATPSPSPVPTPTMTAAERRRARMSPKPAFASSLLRQVSSSGPTDRPLVALTIDDGWSQRDAVLAIIEQKDVDLSLFLAGRPIVGDYGFIARALNAGCEIVNHTMDHYDLTAKSAAYIQDDLAQFEQLVANMVTGATTKPFMRPSGGALNQTVIDASAAAGYRPILWNVSTGDGSTATTPDQMVANAVNGAKPGAIILMHFGDRALVALPRIIDGLRAKGLEPVSLSKLFENVSG